MNFVKAVQEYVSKVLAVPGMKVLILDKETTAMVSMVYSQTEIIGKQVFLVERLEAGNDDEEKAPMEHLKAVVFVRPTAASIKALQAVLKSPKYKEYHLFFSNILSGDHLKQLAQADSHELIRQVQEYFGDYYALEEGLFHVNLPNTRSLSLERHAYGNAERATYDRSVEAMMACLLSLKKRPIMRYCGSSPLAKAMALDLTQRMKEESDLFHTQGQATLLILDRVDDPVTPLLQQWTYQAMVHELLGIKDHRVDMSGVPGIKKELMEVVLSPLQDPFYKTAMHLNFGELGVSIKQLVQEFQKAHNNNSKMDSIEDMQRFVDNYPEFRQLSGNVSKHVSIMTELSRLVEVRALLRVSELEQELACEQDHVTALENLLELLNDASIRFDERLRLVMLYALRYENERNELPQLKSLLRDRAVSDAERSKVRAIDELLAYAGHQVRGGDLFNNKSFMSKASKFLSSGLKGVENIYTRHRPLLASTLDQLLKGKLKAVNYPFMDSRDSGQANAKPQHVIVFIVGGVTYQESLVVQQANAAEGNSGVRIVLGGTSVQNTKSFISDLLQKR
jgi:vacuolar protein sorting-associated protein 45